MLLRLNCLRLRNLTRILVGKTEFGMVGDGEVGKRFSHRPHAQLMLSNQNSSQISNYRECHDQKQRVFALVLFNLFFNFFFENFASPTFW